MAQSMSSMSSSGAPSPESPENRSTSTMPLRIVSVTAPDMSTAPPTLQTAASTSAWRSVTTPAPTDVPKALATSLAPMAMAMRKHATNPATTIHRLPCLSMARRGPASSADDFLRLQQQRRRWAIDASTNQFEVNMKAYMSIAQTTTRPV